MTLVVQVSNLATRIGTEIKSVYTAQGNLASLNTSNKASLVAAINELYAGGGAGSIAINDSAPSTTSVYSSSKVESVVSTAVAAKPSINDAAPSASSVYSSNKTEAAISTAVGAKPSINDTTASASTVYSSSKTVAEINAAVATLVNGSPAALDTLKELSDALGGDANFASTISTALGNRLRFDAAQVLSGPQKTQGLSNLGAQASADIGDTATDFVAVFNAALV
ncbi:hypothetical protein SEA_REDWATTLEHOG_28 [Gordonia phage RedWattleHog]|nr:hypothetical protein SEA_REDWATTLEHOG_28 [Gordonia phage RedWattleHog]